MMNKPPYCIDSFQQLPESFESTQRGVAAVRAGPAAPVTVDRLASRGMLQRNRIPAKPILFACDNV